MQIRIAVIEMRN